MTRRRPTSEAQLENTRRRSLRRHSRIWPSQVGAGLFCIRRPEPGDACGPSDSIVPAVAVMLIPPGVRAPVCGAGGPLCEPAIIAPRLPRSAGAAERNMSSCRDDPDYGGRDDPGQSD